MRNSILFSTMLVISLSAISFSATAQKYKKEVKTLTKNFQKAYNAKEHANLAAMFNNEAVMMRPDGTTVTGAEQIGASYAGQFSAAEQKADIKIGTITPVSDSKLNVTGTYTVTGNVKSSGEKINVSGTYENIVVKENGQWKISMMKLKQNN